MGDIMAEEEVGAAALSITAGDNAESMPTATDRGTENHWRLHL